LLKAGRYSCAYYISGYAVECALKALLARQTKQDDFPPKDANRYYTHALDKLLEFAGLTKAIEDESRKDTIFKLNWNNVKDWSED
jgi:HEPN domain-containing protein